MCGGGKGWMEGGDGGDKLVVIWWVVVWQSSVLLLLFGDVLKVLGEGDLESGLIMLIEAIVLEGVERDGGLQHIFEVNKTKQILPPAACRLLYQSDALVPREGTEDV